MQFRSHFTLMFLVLIFALAIPALAHKGAMGIVKERMDGMTTMKKSMAVIGGMVTGKTALDRDLAIEASQKIALHAAEIKKLFPDTKESRHKATQSTKRVWSHKAEFDALADALVSKTETLKKSLSMANLDQVKVNFLQVGKSCSACHEGFRKPKG